MTWYTGSVVYDTLLLFAFGMVAFTVIGMFIMKAPYGRFGETGGGVAMDPRLGWFLMEFPASVSFFIVYFQGPRACETVPLVFLFVWTVHYANRGYIFPLLMRVAPGSRKSFHLSVVVIGWVVTALHGYLNASFFTRYGSHFTVAWLTDPRFLAGIALYYSGFLLNLHADHIIRTLRPKGAAAQRYSIPTGGAFRYVTSPQYLGELIAWTGFALATWSLAGVFILAISAANLLPRAKANHLWYREKFPDYPKDRKALVPFVW